MKSVVLIGMMGSGKTTCGKRLAALLKREFLDTDAILEAREGRSIAEIFAQEGEPAFRDMETRLCRELAPRTDLVLATGGGLVLRGENAELLQKNGFLVFLNRPAAEIYDTACLDGRPLAQDGRDAFLARFAVREPSYRAAAALEITEFASPESTAQTIFRALQKQEGIV